MTVHTQPTQGPVPLPESVPGRPYPAGRCLECEFTCLELIKDAYLGSDRVLGVGELIGLCMPIVIWYK